MRRLAVVTVVLVALALLGFALYVATGSGGGGADGTGTAAAEHGGGDDGHGRDGQGGRRGRAAGDGRVVGRLVTLAGDTPVVGAVLRLHAASGASAAPLECTSGPGGAFEFPDVPAATLHVLRVVHGEFAPVEQTGVRVEERGVLDLGDVRLAAGTPVTVEVLSSRGEPLAGARVEAYRVHDGAPGFDEPAAPRPAVAASTGPDGTARIAALPPGPWTLVASKAGWARRGRAAAAVHDGDEQRFTIVLDRGQTLRGRVVDGAGAPIPGALVASIRRTLNSDRSVAPLTTRTVADARGRFELSGLPAQDVVLWAARPGRRLGIVAAVRLPGVDEVELVLPRGTTIRGSVTDAEGGPVGGALVEATFHVLRNLGLEARVTSDDDGRYEFLLSLPGTLSWLEASHPEHGSASADECRDDDPVLPDGGVTEIDLVFGSERTITGTVTDGHGPVEGASVGATNMRWWSDTTTDAEGRYRLAGLGAERYFVVVNGPGILQPDRPGYPDGALEDGTAPERYVADVREGAAVIDLEVERVAPIVGTVVDARDESPLAGATITRMSGGPATTSDRDGRFTTPASTAQFTSTIEVSRAGYRSVAVHVPIGGTGGSRSSGGAGTTVEGGSIELVQGGAIELVEGGLPAVEVELAREPGDAGASGSDGFVVRLRPAGLVRGSVTERGGGVPEDAWAQVVPWDDSLRRSLPAEWSEIAAERLPVRPNGRFEGQVTSCESMHVLVRAGAPGFPSTSTRRLELPADGAPLEVEIVLEHSDGFGGVVRDERGAPIAGASVSATPIDRATPLDEFEYPGAWGPPISAVSGPDGRFHVPIAHDGRCVVRAWSRVHVEQREVFELPSNAVELVLGDALTISGRVETDDGTPVAGARVGVGEDTYATRTAPDGTFTAEGLAVGTYTVFVDPDRGGGQNVVPARIDGVAAGARDVVIVTTTGSVLRARVVAHDGTPLAGADVTVYDGDEGTLVSTDTDEDGRFEVAGLAYERVRVEVWHNAYDELGQPYFSDVRPSASVQTLVGPRPVVVRGAVTLEDGSPAPNIDLEFLGQGRPEDSTASSARSSSTGDDGRFEVQLAHGTTYVVVADGESARTLSRNATVRPGEGEPTFVLSSGETITGRVQDEDGRPVSGASIAGSWEYLSRWTTTADDGSFTLSGLWRDADVDLYVSAPDHVDVTRSIAAGTRGVSIRLVRGESLSGRVVDELGDPLAWVTVHAEHRTSDAVRAAHTDSDGNFEMNPVTPGEWDVRLGAGDQPVVRTVRTGEHAHIRVTR